MNKRFLNSLVLLLIFQTYSFAQFNRLKPYGSFILQPLSSIDSQAVLNLSWNAGFESNSLTNQLFADYYFDGTVNRRAAEESLDQLNDINRIGFQNQYQITYYHHKKIFGLFKPYFGIERNSRAASQLSSDLLNLTYKGNAYFANDVAELSNSSFNQITYTGLNLGISNQYKIGKTKVKSFFNLKALAGENYYNFELYKGELFTEEYGEYIDADVDFIYQNNLNGIGNAGWGLGLDFTCNFILPNHTGIQFYVRNLGGIKWNKNTAIYTAKDKYRLSGLYIPYEDLDDINEQNFDRAFAISDVVTVDTVMNSVISNLPFQMGFGYSTFVSDYQYFQIDFDYMDISGYSPRFNLAYYHFLSSFYLAPAVSYGGFTPLSFHLGLGTQFNRYFFEMNIGNYQGLFIKSMPGLFARLNAGIRL